MTMKAKRVLIIDDEVDARRVISKYLERYFPNFKILGEADSFKSAVQLINETEADLIFIDINLGDGTGFDVLDESDAFAAQIIFTTAFDQYAVKAFRYQALDYLMKPIDSELFVDAVNQALDKVRERRSMSADQILISYGNGERKISIPTADGMCFVRLDSIVSFEADSSYCKVFLEDGKEILVSKPLKFFDDKLKTNVNFIRPHKSFIVNMKFVDEYLKEEGGYIKMKNGLKIPISRQKKEDVIRDLQMHFL
jgi:two-component system, LytTR family, response regulator